MVLAARYTVFIRTYLKIAALADTALKMVRWAEPYDAFLTARRVGPCFHDAFSYLPVLCTRHSAGGLA
jgi:hypothetical protein